MELSAYLLIAINLYLVPFIFAIGLIYFIYGCIEYFIIVGAKQHGRELFLKSLLWFASALIIFAIISLFSWFANIVRSPDTYFDGGSDNGNSGGNIERQQRTLGVPNAPRTNTE